MPRRFLLVVCVGLVLTGCCQRAALPAISPLDWLREQPFEPAPSEWSDVITSDLPEGFEAEDPYFETEELPSGETVQVTRIEYQRAVGGGVTAENSVEVNIVGFGSAEARSELLDLLAAEEYEWSFEQLSGGRVARYCSSSVDGRVWVSGPYLIWLFSGVGVNGRGPWVDTFAELYLAQPPSPGAYSSYSPLDWLREQPFEPAPSEWPDAITSGLPEGFEADGPYFTTEELPSGETVQVTRIDYRRAVGGRVEAENHIEVNIVGFGSAEARSETLDLLAAEEYEDYEWSFEQLSGGRVARYCTSGVDGRVWVSGPYLIWLFSSVDGRGPWVDAFAELYLAQPPSPRAPSSPSPPSSPSSLDWLREQPFEPAPSEWPDVITSGLPEGFEAEEPYFETEELPSGETIQITGIGYQRAVEGQVTAENHVEVIIIGFGSAEARLEVLDTLATEDGEWSFEQLSGGRVARYRMSGGDSRMWFSGPYLVMVSIGAEDRGPLVNAFAELYLAQYPSE